MEPSDHTTRALIGGALGALGAVFTAAALVGLRGDIVNVNVALILVIFVLLSAVTGGRAAGAAAAMVAGISYDFFHTKPYNSLKISDSNDIITTVLLVAVGLAVGEIAIRAQRLHDERAEEQEQLHRMQRVASLAASGEEADDLVRAVTRELRATLGLRSCWLERPPFLVSLPRLERTGVVPTTEHLYANGEFELPREGVELPVVARGRTLGRFVLVPTAGVGVSKERRLSAVALADQMGAALATAAA